MEPTASKPHSQDIVDTTDSLEAVGACRSMKNFLFWVIFIGLLLPQLFFWLDRMDLIDTACGVSCARQTGSVCAEPAGPPAAAAAPAGPIALAATVIAADTPTEAPAAPAPANAEAIAEQVDRQLQTRTDTTETDAAPAAAAETDPAAQTPQQAREPMRIPCRFAVTVVAVCNFLVLLAAILYCLCLLMCLKISLTGRLGGINHITHAFFVSLLLVVILVPWQRLLPGVLVGGVWLPGELLCGGWDRAGESAFWSVLFYLRFVGLWFVTMWLLFWAQIRSAKWARATLRRLGITR